MNIFDKAKKILSKQNARIKFPLSAPYANTGPGTYLSQVYGNQRLASALYEQSLAATTDRLQRLRDYDLMDSTPIVSTALTVYADDGTTLNENNQVIEIISDNHKVQAELEKLWFDILDVNYNSYFMFRNTCKYGDSFYLLSVEPGKGVTGQIALPTTEIEREEAFDGDPNSIRYRWISQAVGYFDDIQISHFRLRGDDNFLPYGRSILESGRRSWKQLQMLEDAMMIYRISRAAERRVFHIEVAGLPIEQVPNYMEQQRARVKSDPIIDPATGDIDLRFRVNALTDDYWFAKRGDMMSTVETLPGASNLNDIEDVELIKQELITSLGVPKAFLQYSDDLEGKSSASKVDIRFARTIQRIQRVHVSEFIRTSIIHLIMRGFDERESLNFDIKMQNPSAIMELGKLELMEKRFDIYNKAVNESKSISPLRAKREILLLTDQEIAEEERNIVKGAKFAKNLKNIEEAPAPQPSMDGQPEQQTSSENPVPEEKDETEKQLDDFKKEEDHLKNPLGRSNSTKQATQGEFKTKTGLKTDSLNLKNQLILGEIKKINKSNLKKYFNK